MIPVSQPPPKLLLGTSLLFWGAMTERPVIGLLLALLVESANWTRFRWDFHDSAVTRAWKLTPVIIIIFASLLMLEGERHTALPRLLIWLPLLFIPLQFVQAFGFRNSLPLNCFSFFSQLHRKRNLKRGLPASVVHFNVGNIYFITIIISSAIGRNASHLSFIIGVVTLTGWLLFSKTRARLVPLAILIILGGGIGIVGQTGLTKLYNWATSTSYAGGYPGINPTESRTSIGSLGEIKQSPEIKWRLRPQPRSVAPRLLRTATYNRYRGISWENRLPAEFPEDDDDFRPLDTLEIIDGEIHYLLSENADAAAIRPGLPTFQIKGSARNDTVLPLPLNAASLRHFELDGIEINLLGTTRIFPKRAIIEGSVKWRDNTNPESPPYEDEDLAIPEREEEIIRQLADQLGLAEAPTLREKLHLLQSWFASEFEYTRYLSLPRPRNHRRDEISPVGLFLTVSKKGHCEYFATSSALLLRAANIPTRYNIGYSVQERDLKRNEFVVRGIHGHAWCNVWDADINQWIDFDPTPPNWLAAETTRQTSTQNLSDAFQRFKEDFFLWRNRPVNRLGATIVMWTIGIAVFAFLATRLWKSKLTVEREKSKTHLTTLGKPTPLHRLEPRARRILGPRPPGLTLPTWLRRLPENLAPPATLHEAITLHQQLRFDPQPTTTTTNLPRLTELTESLEKSLKTQ